MKTFLVSMGIVQFDGRLQELRKACSGLGEVKLTCFTIDKKVDGIYSKGQHYSIKNFFKLFVISVVNFFKNRDSDVLFIDNCYAAYIGVFLSYFVGNKPLVYDMRELYLGEGADNIKLRMLLFFESLLIKKATVVIVANKYRADKVKEHFRPDGEVLVFENIRFLTGTTDVNVEAAHYIDDIFCKLESGSVRVISTSGYVESRGADVLVQQFLKLPVQYKLFLVGGGQEVAVKRFGSKKLKGRVFFIDKVDMNTLKYILSKADIGVVHYSFSDINNILCASGKVYEYIGEGLPIVATEHKTLEDFCTNSQAGLCDNLYIDAVIEVAENLQKYKDNAKAFASNQYVQNYTSEFTEKLYRAVTYGK